MAASKLISLACARARLHPPTHARTHTHTGDLWATWECVCPNLSGQRIFDGRDGQLLELHDAAFVSTPFPGRRARGRPSVYIARSSGRPMKHESDALFGDIFTVVRRKTTDSRHKGSDEYMSEMGPSIARFVVAVDSRQTGREWNLNHVQNFAVIWHYKIMIFTVYLNTVNIMTALCVLVFSSDVDACLYAFDIIHLNTWISPNWMDKWHKSFLWHNKLMHSNGITRARDVQLSVKGYRQDLHCMHLAW